MPDESGPTYTAFAGPRRVASGALYAVALACRAAAEQSEARPPTIFDDRTGRVVDLEVRGPADEFEERVTELEAEATEADYTPRRSRRGPGRPRLGVVAKEITLLPRHWAWLAAQRGSASATLRRLIDDTRRSNECEDEVRRAQDATYRFATATAGDLSGYEEAMRALYAGDRARFESESLRWPDDVRGHARTLAREAFRPGPTTPSEASD
jgi:uncharacterized protein